MQILPVIVKGVSGNMKRNQSRRSPGSHGPLPSKQRLLSRPGTGTRPLAGGSPAAGAAEKHNTVFFLCMRFGHAYGCTVTLGDVRTMRLASRAVIEGVQAALTDQCVKLHPPPRQLFHSSFVSAVICR